MKTLGNFFEKKFPKPFKKLLHKYTETLPKGNNCLPAENAFIVLFWRIVRKNGSICIYNLLV